MHILILLIGSIVGGILYRLGGTGGAWWKNTKVRDVGVTLITLLTLWLIGGTMSWWVWGLCGLLLFGALTTYWKGDAPDVRWYHWLMTGLAYGLAMFPYAIVSGAWVWWGIRCVVLSVGTMMWSEAIDSDWLEEFGRGVLIVGTIGMIGG